MIPKSCRLFGQGHAQGHSRLIRHGGSDASRTPLARLTRLAWNAHITGMDELRGISQRIGRMTPLADALACIDRLVAPVRPCRTLLDKAAGFTLAADIINRDAHPGSAIALRDGIAVAAD